ncbi:MAG: TraB/GumN family protein [Bacteroidia bacterium]
MRHLRYLIIALAAYGSFYGNLSGQNPENDSLSQPIENHGLFWEISGNGLTKPSFLYGTIHIIPKDSFFILPGLEEKLSQARRLVLEVPLDISMETILSSMQMFIPGGKTLQSLMEPEDYTYLTSFMRDSISVPMPFYQRIKPIFISQHISSNYCFPEEMESYELYFSSLAKKENKPVSGLETITEQMQYLDDMSLEEQVTSLVSIIRNPGAGCEEFGKMIAAYRKQDLNFLMEMMSESDDLEGHLDQLLDARNKKWISKIEAFVHKEQVFIAVGAGHLSGPNGVVSLLQAAGYTLKPVQ